METMSFIRMDNRRKEQVPKRSRRLNFSAHIQRYMSKPEPDAFRMKTVELNKRNKISSIFITVISRKNIRRISVKHIKTVR